MFTDHQHSILCILAREPDREFSMSDLGRLLGKAPGFFQRGLNSLEERGYIACRRVANRRLLRFNLEHPLQKEVGAMVRQTGSPLPSDIYMTYEAPVPAQALRVAEPPGIYEVSARKILIIAGPNGAGKTTFAREFLPQEAGCPIFINADYINALYKPLVDAWVLYDSAGVRPVLLDEDER